MNMLEKLQKEFDDALASMTPADWKALDNINQVTASRQAELLLKARIQAYKIKMEAQAASIFNVASFQVPVQPLMALVRGELYTALSLSESNSSTLSGEYAYAMAA